MGSKKPLQQTPMISWQDPNSLVSPNFTVHQCLELPQWFRMANEKDGLNDVIKQNLIKLCNKLEVIQAILGASLDVHSMYRPSSYSPLVGGTSTDVHTRGMACDFHVEGMSMEAAAEKIKPLLEGLDMRMEQGTLTWVHLDIHPPGPSGRYFIPF